MNKEIKKTIDIDKVLYQYEEIINEIGLQYIQITGEQLLKAKEKIIEETGDKRAPGFIDWAERKFGFKHAATARYIKAFQENLTDVKKIWGNEKSCSSTSTTIEQSSSRTWV